MYRGIQYKQTSTGISSAAVSVITHARHTHGVPTEKQKQTKKGSSAHSQKERVEVEDEVPAGVEVEHEVPVGVEVYFKVIAQVEWGSSTTTADQAIDNSPINHCPLFRTGFRTATTFGG